MISINRLIGNYHRFVRLPWQTNLAGKQRVGWESGLQVKIKWKP